MIFIRFFIIISCLIQITYPAQSNEPKIITNQESTLIYPAFWHTPFGLHRGTQEHLAYFTNHAARFNRPQAMTCMPLISNANQPENISAFQLTVIGVNSGEANIIYNPSMFGLAIIKSTNQFELLAPLDVAASKNNLLYLTDPGNRMIHFFKPINNQLVWQGRLNPPPSAWQKPAGLACDQNGGCYISDEQAQIIAYYNAGQQFIKSIGPVLSQKITLSRPRALAVTTKNDSWSFFKQDSLFICDQDGKRLIKTDLDGHVLHWITAGQVGNSLTMFAWLALDYYNNLWVTAPSEDKIYKFDHQLNYLDTVGQSGEGDYLFNYPTGITINRHFGQVFIAEKNSVHYFWIGADIEQTHAVFPDKQQKIELNFFLTEPAYISITTVYKSRQQVIYKKLQLGSGRQTLVWQHPRPVDRKFFTINIQAEATYSSRTHFAKKVTVKLE